MGYNAAMNRAYVCIDVPDLDAAASFYCGALELERLGESRSNIKLDAGGVEVYLLRKEAGTPPTPSPGHERAYARHWTPVHLDFRVADIDLVVQRVTDAGGVVEHMTSGDWGAIAHCADPFGNGFCLIRQES